MAGVAQNRATQNKYMIQASVWDPLTLRAQQVLAPCDEEYSFNGTISVLLLLKITAALHDTWEKTPFEKDCRLMEMVSNLEPTHVTKATDTVADHAVNINIPLEDYKPERHLGHSFA